MALAEPPSGRTPEQQTACVHLRGVTARSSRLAVRGQRDWCILNSVPLLLGALC